MTLPNVLRKTELNMELAVMIRISAQAGWDKGVRKRAISALSKL